MLATLSVSLESAQLLKCLRPCHVSLCKRALDIDIAIFLLIQIHLQVIVNLVCIVLTIELSLHSVDILVNAIDFVQNATFVSIDTVQLLQNQIQTLLQGVVIGSELLNVFIGSRANWADRLSDIGSCYEPIAGITHVHISDGTL